MRTGSLAQAPPGQRSHCAEREMVECHAMSGTVRIEKEGAIGWLVFDHPERRNAITVDMWRAIPGAARTLAEDDAVRVVVLRGAGNVAFVSGADISEFESQRSGGAIAEYDADSGRAFAALGSLPKPVLAMIHGFCIGGGLAIALSADVRYAADDATFAIPAARLGLGYHAAGVEALVRTVGLSAAKEILFTARRFRADEALRRRLIDEVVAKGELETFVRDAASTIARNAPLTLRSIKLITGELTREPAARDTGAIEKSIAACYASEDYREGVGAFLAKRRPRFRGC